MQPNWVPPNVKFEIDDATQPWTWPEHTLDFVHIRFLNSAIKDWHALFREAYRCCKPGGYVESGEFDPRYYCDDGTADGVEVIETWNSVFEMGAQKLGYSFTDINVFAYKAPVGAWAKDQKLAEIGRFTQLTLENDMEGYTLFLWTNVLGWPKDEYQIFLMSMRKVLRNTANIHIYCKYKYVYGRKPVDRAAS
ncbi:S-adenosyl-L-methionine-dependent methyltransferase [Fusarium oxysporum f. sp. albedinis]|nr:S-adenosyl-L-methionine-dependent methyltransferase [Fusarium oxysporum f. sp. albedinis]